MTEAEQVPVEVPERAVQAGVRALHDLDSAECSTDCPASHEAYREDVTVVLAAAYPLIWDALLAAQSEVMTTAQRNAWRDAVAELRQALTAGEVQSNG